MFCVKSNLFKKLESIDPLDIRLAGIRALRYRTLRRLLSSIKFHDVAGVKEYLDMGPVIYFVGEKIILFDEQACVVAAGSAEEAGAAVRALEERLRAAGLLREEAAGPEKKKARKKK